MMNKLYRQFNHSFSCFSWFLLATFLKLVINLYVQINMKILSLVLCIQKYCIIQGKFVSKGRIICKYL